MWANEFYTILFFLVVLLACGCCGSIISAITFDLFPTSIKAMALCFVLMIGRLCAALGSNIIGWLLVANCDAVFYVVGGVLLGKVFVFTDFAIESEISFKSSKNKYQIFSCFFQLHRVLGS